MTTEQLKQLRVDTNKAIDVLIESPCGGPVNWYDLACRQAAWVTTDSGDSYAEVLIEEASPNAVEFPGRIREELRKAGWPDVRVVTEW